MERRRVRLSIFSCGANEFYPLFVGVKGKDGGGAAVVGRLANNCEQDVDGELAVKSKTVVIMKKCFTPTN